MKHFFRGQRLAVMSVVLGMLLGGAVSVYAGTTIGTNITTDGMIVVGANALPPIFAEFNDSIPLTVIGTDAVTLPVIATSDGFAQGDFSAGFLAQAGDVDAHGNPTTPGSVYPLGSFYVEREDTTNQNTLDWGIHFDGASGESLAGNFINDIGIGNVQGNYGTSPVNVSNANLFIKGDGTLAAFKSGMLVQVGGSPITPFQGLYVGPDESTLPSFLQGYTSPQTALFTATSGAGIGIESTGPFGVLSAVTSGGMAFEGDTHISTDNTDTYTFDSEPYVRAGVAGRSVYGFFADSPSLLSGASLQNQYGLYVADLTQATNNYAIKTGLGKVSFGDNVGIGTTTPSTRLVVTAGANATTTVTVGELGLTTSKTCINMNRANGQPGSMYLSAAGVLVVENNYCR